MFQFLLWRKYNGPNVAESYCWPAVARGFDTVLVSHSGDNPLSYIPPLLMLLQTVSVVSSLAARTGVRFTALLWMREKYSCTSNSHCGSLILQSVLGGPITSGHCTKYTCKMWTVHL